VQEDHVTGRAAAIVLALALNQVSLHGQDLVFTVNVASADVHKGPSIATPVIGHVSRGTAMPVTRNLGSWVKVSWPAAPDGFAYLHVTTGRLMVPNGDAPASTSAPRASSATAPASAPQSAAASTTPVQIGKPPRPARERVVIRQQGSTPISHVVGIGGLFGSTDTFGASARAWRDNGLGLQFGFTRGEMTSSVAPGRVTSFELEPALVYGLFDRVGDYFWFRPYVGAGVSMRHQSLQDAAPAGGGPSTTTAAGFRAFGGAEMTFAGAPRFALSVDAGYRQFSTSFPGFEPDRFSAIVSGHWYVK
jgi:hypothetical protein